MQQFIGWLISTLLLRLIGGGGSDSETEMQPSKYTQSNINQIGSTIPAVLGRVMIKDPLIAYYGGFDAKIYTEEYGLWSDVDWDIMLWMFILSLIAALTVPNKVVTNPGQPVSTTGGGGQTSGTGTGQETTQGAKNKAMMNAVVDFLVWLLVTLFINHLGRVTIQKGFKYYLGWQNILCWTGDNIGIKKVWMNIYDTEVEDSTMSGAWSIDNANATPYTIYEDNNTTNVVSTYYSYWLDLGDRKYIDEITFWYQGIKPNKATCYISSVDYEVSDDNINWTNIGNNTQPPTANNYDIKLTAPQNTIAKYIRLNMNCVDIANTNIDLDIKDIKVGGKDLDQIAYRSQNPTGLVAHIDDPEMFGGWDEGGGFIGDVNIYFGGYQQQKDPWMIQEMTNSANIPQQLKGLTPLYPMFLTCVVKDNDNTSGAYSGAYIGKQATIPEIWFEVVNYPDHLGTSQHPMIRQKYVDKLAELWKPVDDFMKTMQPPVQAYMQPYMDNIVNEYNNFVNSGNDDVSNLVQALEDAVNNFPITGRDQYELVQAEVEKLAKHGVWTLGRLGDDLNPAEAIYEILVNDMWGCGYDGSRIDIVSLVDLGITCENENLGISMLMNQTQQVREYLQKIMTHINGVFFDNPLTGKLVFRLMRNDFDPNKIKKFDTSNCVSCEFSRLDWSEAISSISVKFTDARDKYNTSELMVNDLANKIIVGSDIQKQVDGSYFTTAVSARWMAQSQLLSAGYPLSMVNLECNRKGFDSLIGDPILLYWQPYGITKQVYRIVDIDYATLTSGKISISAVEDVFSFDKTDYEFSDIPAWDEPDKRPYDIARYLFMEMPYEWTFSLDTFMYAWATQPSNYTIYWDIWRYDQGTYGISAKTQNWTACARFEYGYEEKFEFDTVGVEIRHVGTNSEDWLDKRIVAIANNPSMYNHTSNLNTLITAERDPLFNTYRATEIMSYDTIVKLPNGNYMLQGVVRGILDTLPKKHTTETIIFFNDASLSVTNGVGPGNGRIQQQGAYKTEQLEIRTETATQAQPFDLNLVDILETTRRSEQPSVMGNLQFGADRGTETNYWYSIQPYEYISGDILFRFLGRNKYNSFGIIEQTDATTAINVAPTTQNVLNVSCNGVTFEYMWDAWDATNLQNITEMTLKWADFCKELNNKVSESNTAILKVRTYDTNLQIYSYDQYQRTIQYSVPRLVGILDDPSKVQIYADSIVDASLNSIVVPQTTISPQLTLTFEDCPLIFIGDTNLAQGQTPVFGQDGVGYNLSTDAYRIDGCDNNGNAIVHKITIEDEYVFRTNFTVLANNFADYFRYRGGVYVGYIPY